MDLIQVKINNKDIEVEPGTTILDAAKKLNIHIPTLCYLKLHDKKTINSPASCRICVVEIVGRKNLAPACCTSVTPNMIIKTNSPKVISSRKTILELIISNHCNDCLTCAKNQKCELQALASEYGIDSISFKGSKSPTIKENTNCSIVRDTSKCILCRRCESICTNIQGISAIGPINRGFDTILSTAFFQDLDSSNCSLCGQCVAVCPTGALIEKDNTSEVFNVLADPSKFVVVQTAPSVRAALGEEFGILEESVTGKMISALRELGFDRVYDSNFAADLTIVEEAKEFLSRYNKNSKLPMFTSCCPGWINFIEKHYENLTPLLSTCKSPQQMWGAIAKTYLAEKLGISKDKLVVVSVMPCLAKKYEAKRPELNNDVDIVISTRELAKMIRTSGIPFTSLPDDNFDKLMGESTGASSIFGTSGGVMEAALRTSYEWISNKTLKNIDFEAVRGLDGVKEASLEINGNIINVAVVNGLKNAKHLLDNIESTSKKYHFIEVMACPGGCINGGGQPYSNNNYELIEKRKNLLYLEDANKSIRKSHENPEIINLYSEFLNDSNNKKAHDLLHTHYKTK